MAADVEEMAAIWDMGHRGCCSSATSNADNNGDQNVRPKVVRSTPQHKWSTTLHTGTVVTPADGCCPPIRHAGTPDETSMA